METSIYYFTDGEWVLKECNNITFETNFYSYLIEGNNNIICEKNQTLNNIKEHKANAKLISKAPDMLKMLISLYDLIKPMGKIEFDMRNLIEEASGKNIKEIIKEQN